MKQPGGGVHSPSYSTRSTIFHCRVYTAAHSNSTRNKLWLDVRAHRASISSRRIFHASKSPWAQADTEKNRICFVLYPYRPWYIFDMLPLTAGAFELHSQCLASAHDACDAQNMARSRNSTQKESEVEHLMQHHLELLLEALCSRLSFVSCMSRRR